jgi:hypothetical protein
MDATFMFDGGGCQVTRGDAEVRAGAGRDQGEETGETGSKGLEALGPWGLGALGP